MFISKNFYIDWEEPNCLERKSLPKERERKYFQKRGREREGKYYCLRVNECKSTDKVRDKLCGVCVCLCGCGWVWEKPKRIDWKVLWRR